MYGAGKVRVLYVLIYEQCIAGLIYEPGGFLAFLHAV